MVVDVRVSSHIELSSAALRACRWYVSQVVPSMAVYVSSMCVKLLIRTAHDVYAVTDTKGPVINRVPTRSVYLFHENRKRAQCASTLYQIDDVDAMFAAERPCAHN